MIMLYEIRCGKCKKIFYGSKIQDRYICLCRKCSCIKKRKIKKGELI